MQNTSESLNKSKLTRNYSTATYMQEDQYAVDKYN